MNSLQTHIAEVQQLVGLAYNELPEDYQHRMSINIFCSSLGNSSLKWPLLALEAPILESVIQASNDFPQIHTPSERPCVTIQCVYDPEEDSSVANLITPSSKLDPLDLLQTVVKLMQCIAEQMD